jgi:drug/metabolite transporter (DMT)-like permease
MHQRTANLFIAALTVVTASSFLGGKYVLQVLDPLSLVAYRFTIATLVLLPFAVAHLGRMSRSDLAGGLIIGICLSCGMIGLTYGLLHTHPGRASFLISLDFLFIALFEVILLGKKLSMRTLVGTIIGFLGLCILVLRSESASHDPTLFDYFVPSVGDVLILGGAFFFALFTIANSYFSPKTDPKLVGLLQVMVVACVSGFALVLFRPKEEVVVWSEFSSFLWWWLLYLGVITTGFRFFLQSYLQRFTTATHTGVIFLLEPVVATGLGVYFLDEPLSLLQVIGSLTIIVSTVIVHGDSSGHLNQEVV